MRFGLSDLEELPSLKEFEALAREALGAMKDSRRRGRFDERGELRRAHGRKFGERDDGSAGELLEETAANNEGMPEAESGEAQKSCGGGGVGKEFNTEAQSSQRRKEKVLASLGCSFSLVADKGLGAFPLRPIRKTVQNSWKKDYRRLLRGRDCFARHAELLILSGQVRVNGHVGEGIGDEGGRGEGPD